MRGDSAFLSVIDRPTKLDSACSVPSGQVIVEIGYQYANLYGGGTGQNYPQAELRFGLPKNNEFVVLLPNYNHQSVSPISGTTASVVGLKHEIGYNEHWLGAVEALTGLPTGNKDFGSNHFQPVVNGIIQYSFTPSLNVVFMFGAASYAIPPSAGGQSYFTLNPDAVLSWQASDKISIFGEIYGQTHTGPGQGSGYDSDLGILYLVTHNLTFDAEIGQRISGELGGFNNYVGVGIGVWFG